MIYLPGTLAQSALDLLALYPQFSATSKFLSLGHHRQGTKVSIWPQDLQKITEFISFGRCPVVQFTKRSKLGARELVPHICPHPTWHILHGHVHLLRSACCRSAMLSLRKVRTIASVLHCAPVPMANTSKSTYGTSTVDHHCLGQAMISHIYLCSN